MTEKTRKILIAVMISGVALIILLLVQPWRWFMTPSTLGGCYKRLARTKSAEQQVKLLNVAIDNFAYYLDSHWAEELDCEVRRDLPDDLIPDTGDAEAVRKLPASFEGRKFIALMDDDGTLRMQGNLFVRLPKQMRAPSIQAVEAVLYGRRELVPRETEEGTVQDQQYTFYVLDRETGKVYRILSVRQLYGKGGTLDDEETRVAREMPREYLFEALRRAMMIWETRSFDEDRKYYRESYEWFDDMQLTLDALRDLIAEYPDECMNENALSVGFGRVDPGASEWPSKLEPLRRFLPEISGDCPRGELPDRFLGRKFVVISARTWNDDSPEVSLALDGYSYLRFPEDMRAATWEEADAALLLFYGTTWSSYGNYYYVSSYGGISYGSTASTCDVYAVDLTDGFQINLTWFQGDPELHRNIDSRDVWPYIEPELEAIL